MKSHSAFKNIISPGLLIIIYIGVAVAVIAGALMITIIRSGDKGITYKSDNFGIEITAPSGWEIFRRDSTPSRIEAAQGKYGEEYMLVSFLKQISDTEDLSIMLQAGKHFNADGSPVSYSSVWNAFDTNEGIDKYINILKSGMEFTIVEQPYNISIGERKGIGFVGDFDTERQIYMVFGDNYTTYVLQCGAPIEQFEYNRASFEKIIKSIKFTK